LKKYIRNCNRHSSHLILPLLLAVLVLFQCSYSFPSGAPVQHCQDMIPGHNAEPLRETSPFKIKYSLENRHKPTTSLYYVTIYSDVSKTNDDRNSTFKGFLLEARETWDGKTIGKWSTDVSHTKTIDCFDDPQTAVTHHYDDDSGDSDGELDTKKHFSQVTFTWRPPQSFSIAIAPNASVVTESIKFVATVVEKFDRIYTNVSRSILIKKRNRAHFKTIRKHKTAKFDLALDTKNSTN